MDGFASGIQVDPQTPPSPSISQPPKPGSGIIINPLGGRPLVLSNCCGGDFIQTLLIADIVVGPGSPFDCITETYDLFYLESFNEWAGSQTCDHCKNTKIWISLNCFTYPQPKGSVWVLFVDIIADKRRSLHPTMTLKSVNCDNFKLVFSGTIFHTWPITVTITPPPPITGPILPA